MNKVVDPEVKAVELLAPEAHAVINELCSYKPRVAALRYDAAHGDADAQATLERILS